MLDKDYVSSVQRFLHHIASGTTDSAPDIMRMCSSNYVDPHVYAREIERIFKRLPLVLAFSCELPERGDYRALVVAGVPVLIVRGADRRVRAFVNICTHRGTGLKAEGCGRATRFTCPYHAWTFDDKGALIGITDAAKFGAVDKAERALTSLPCDELAGLIFVCLTPGLKFDVPDFLGGMRDQLERLGLSDWHFHHRSVYPSPNWKITREGYLEGYHFATVHPTTIATRLFSGLMVIDSFEDHVKLSFAERGIVALTESPEGTWVNDAFVKPTWLVFPNLAIAPRPNGAMITQLFPGRHPGQSQTIQNFLFHQPPQSAADHEAYDAVVEGFRHSVIEEDYPVLLSIQQGLESGAAPDFVFGRNELAVQLFHAAIARHLSEIPA